MTRNRKHKNAIRELAARSGMSYTAAHRLLSPTKESSFNELPLGYFDEKRVGWNPSVAPHLFADVDSEHIEGFANHVVSCLKGARMAVSCSLPRGENRKAVRFAAGGLRTISTRHEHEMGQQGTDFQPALWQGRDFYSVAVFDTPLTDEEIESYRKHLEPLMGAGQAFGVHSVVIAPSGAKKLAYALGALDRSVLLSAEGTRGSFDLGDKVVGSEDFKLITAAERSLGNLLSFPENEIY